MSRRAARRRFTRRAFLRGVAGGAGLLAAAAGGFPSAGGRETRSISLAAGWNAATWCGPELPPAAAFAGLPLIAAHSWEVGSRSWISYAPNTPIDTIGVLRHGQPVWMQLERAAEWSQPFAPNGLPEAVELPVGWSFVGWSGLRQPVWTAFGEDPLGPVAEARRWNSELGEWLAYTPGQSAQQLFAVLHPGDAIWLRMRIAGARWNPASGIAPADFAARVVPGVITYYHPSLAGGVMFCPPHDRYDPSDPNIAAANTWPCGTRLRIWRGERFVDVIVQDTGGDLGLNHVDLSEAAFRRLALLPEGRVDVLIEVTAGIE